MRPAPSERHQAERFLELGGWTTVKLPRYGDSYQIESYPDQFIRMMKWCEDHLGAGRAEPNDIYYNRYNGDVWYAFTWYGYWNFHFKHSKDATAFSLKWI